MIGLQRKSLRLFQLDQGCKTALSLERPTIGKDAILLVGLLAAGELVEGPDPKLATMDGFKYSRVCKAELYCVAPCPPLFNGSPVQKIRDG